MGAHPRRALAEDRALDLPVGAEGQPEAEIGRNPTAYLEEKLSLWTKSGTLDAYDNRALQHYRDFFNDPSRIHACCEDYRAGATVDLAADEADKAAGRTIGAPVHVVWGDAGIPSAGSSPLDAWKVFAPAATARRWTVAISCRKRTRRGALRAAAVPHRNGAALTGGRRRLTRAAPPLNRRA